MADWSSKWLTKKIPRRWKRQPKQLPRPRLRLLPLRRLLLPRLLRLQRLLLQSLRRLPSVQRAVARVAAVGVAAVAVTIAAVAVGAVTIVVAAVAATMTAARS
jgi:hypothetical protein